MGVFIIYIGAIIFTSGQFGVGNGPVAYYNLDCFGSEKGLSECKKYEQLFNCYDPYIIGIRCLECKMINSF